MRMRGNLPLIIVPAVLVVCLMLFGCDQDGSSYEEQKVLHVRDKDLLTPEEQRILVREGRVTKEINGVQITFFNTPEMKPYLNEGGLE